MSTDEIRKLWKQQPFNPFEIVMVDGRVFRVRHPDFLLVPPPRGQYVVVVDEEGLPEYVNTLVISSVRILNDKGGKPRKKAG